MAALNNECVRALMLWIEKTQTVGHNGKPNALKLRHLPDEFPSFPADDVWIAATYLAEKKLITLCNQDLYTTAPRAYVVSEIAASGYDYLAAIRDDTVWKKIKERLGSAMLASVPTVIELASKLL